MGNFFVVIFLCHEGKTEHDKKQAAEDLGKHDGVFIANLKL